MYVHYKNICNKYQHQKCIYEYVKEVIEINIYNINLCSILLQQIRVV